MTNKIFLIHALFRRHISLSSAFAARVTKVPLPALSPTMESGSIVSWDKKEGDRLNEGDLLAEIETDKATMAFETPEEGYLAKILVPAGTKGVPLGQPLCIIVEEEDDLGKYKAFSAEQAIEAAGGGDTSAQNTSPSTPSSTPVQSPANPPKPIQSTPPPQSTPLPPINPTSRVFVSPLARKLARDNDLQIPQVGSGSNGRVVANDLMTATDTRDSSAIATRSGSEFIDIPLTGMRQTIAKRLTQSKQNLPHYYLTVNLNVDELLELRKRFNEQLAKENIKLSVNDFIVKAAAAACLRVPQVNSSWQDTYIRQYNHVDVSVAVSTDSGLITPIVFNADGKGIQQIGSDIKLLAEKARQGKLLPHEFQGGTFTISNLGMFEVDHFTAVINPPQSAILAVGSTKQIVVPVKEPMSDEKFRAINVMNVTLSCDHRVVDGAVGAQWLQWFRKFIEKPYNMLL